MSDLVGHFVPFHGVAIEAARQRAKEAHLKPGYVLGLDGKQYSVANASARRARQARQFPSGKVVYVIGSEESRLVKLGRTADLDQRLAQLQGSSPAMLSVFLFAPGGVLEEWFLHRYFAPHRRHGEWFDLGPEPAVVAREALELLASIDLLRDVSQQLAALVADLGPGDEAAVL